MNWLISKLDHIGDFAICLPGLRAIADRANGEALDVVVSPWNLGWKEVLPWIDQFYSIEFPAYQHGRIEPVSRLTTCRDALRLWNELRRREYGAAVDLRMDRDDWRGKFICWMSGAPVRIGSGGKGGFFLTREGEERSVHQSDKVLERLRMVRDKIEPKWDGLVNLGGKVPQVRGRVVIHPGAGVPSKQWLGSSWVSLVAVLKQAGIADLVLTGGPRDAAMLETLRGEAGLPTESVRPGRSIKESLKLFASAEVVVGLDSAAPHLAALVDTRAVTLFSAANDPQRWRALGRNDVLFHSVPCSPCKAAVCRQPTHLCMEAITPAMVRDAVLKQLQADR